MRTSRGLLQSRFLARQLSCCAWRVDELVRDCRYCNGTATAVAASMNLDCWNNAAGVAEQHHHRLGQLRLLKIIIRRRIITTFSGRWTSSSFGMGGTCLILGSPHHHHLDRWEGHLHRPGSHPLSGKRQDLLYLQYVAPRVFLVRGDGRNAVRLLGYSCIFCFGNSTARLCARGTETWSAATAISHVYLTN